MKPLVIISATLGLLIAGSVLIVLVQPHTQPSAPSAADVGIPYTEIVSPSGFVNTDGITLSELVGKKVILVDFMTYSCINCQRTFPHLSAWYEEYKHQGLEIVGIHTPEFAFERDIENVQRALEEFGIQYPVVLDNEYATWRAYGNRYWPRKYLIDIHGNVVYDHIGEGAYEETERKIRELLDERAEVLGTRAVSGGALASDTILDTRGDARSPETYFGAARNEYLRNGIAGKVGVQQFAVPDDLRKNALYLQGPWHIEPEYAQSDGETAITYRFEGTEVYLVANADTPVTVEVWLDGALVDAMRGVDVAEDGTVSVHESRLYKLILLDEPGTHTLELRVRGPGMRAYAFTFG